MPSEFTSSIGRFGLIAAGGYAFGPIGAVLRTETAITTTSFTYTSGMQSADFGGAQTELSFVVYQISAQVGRGFPGEATVEIVP